MLSLGDQTLMCSMTGGEFSLSPFLWSPLVMCKDEDASPQAWRGVGGIGVSGFLPYPGAVVGRRRSVGGLEPSSMSDLGESEKQHQEAASA